ncbi:putative tannase [Aspergillus steynii IBT 23096]|uniref:Carboxylic ester hydrolase n=1 Tax=Aspergillus steynii IBT 23096 TaxID=1392250 RepID=A0A2I2G3A9_9EURO|nr:putative tannase [Aspergillus steynii IBT 23096]PLB47366.1 putative tannase [Aspergillus steynii IBT 23096]
MKPAVGVLASAAGLKLAQAASLADVCTPAHVKSVLPASDSISGLKIDSSSITANAVYNASTSGGTNFPAATYDYCNVTLAYSHPGRDDQVLLGIWMPAPEKFQNRWLSTGGGGYAINSGDSSLPGGVQYGAASGYTDGGFGSFNTQVDAVILHANGTLNYEALYMFGYQAHHELSIVGKALTKSFYDTSDSKLYAYYQGCSEGGREGWSQVQRFPDEWDGAVIGAPAFRYGQQQVNHLYPGVVEHTMGYYPPPCELEKIVNMTIAACDKLDGRADGVVARTDLCKLHFNVNSTIGAPYSCAASSSRHILKRVFMDSTTPAQNGTVSAQGAAAASKMLEGLHTLDGRQAYIWYQPSATFDDAQTQYNSETKKFELSITSLGGEWVTRFLQLQDLDNLSSLDNVTYDTLKDWMELGWKRYEDVLQTTWPDLTPFQKAGGKVLHYHGESDNSIPAGSSVHYHESVRKIMYPGQSFEESSKALNEWNRLFLIPGAAHCSPSTNQPNGPFPQTTLETLIDWVENGATPDRLNATVQSGDHEGEKQELCAWPLRPLWKNNGTSMDCVHDQKSLDTWDYKFDAYRVPLY